MASANLSPGIAWLLSAFIATSYVASVYTFRAGRPDYSIQQATNGPAKIANEAWRNNPDTIRARLFGVTINTVLSCALVFMTVWYTGNPKVRSCAN